MGGCCLGGKKYEYDFILNEFWQYQKITKMSSNEYINLILKNKEIFSEYNLNIKNLKEKFFKNIFDIESETQSRFYNEAMKLITKYLDISDKKPYSLLISLMFFTKYDKFVDLYNNLQILFNHLSSKDFFQNGFDNSFNFDYEFFKKILIDYYKICSNFTYEIIDKGLVEELNNNQFFVVKCFSEHMIETQLINYMGIDKESSNLIGFFNLNQHYLNHKDVRISLYYICEEFEKKHNIKN